MHMYLFIKPAVIKVTKVTSQLLNQIMSHFLKVYPIHLVNLLPTLIQSQLN